MPIVTRTAIRRLLLPALGLLLNTQCALESHVDMDGVGGGFVGDGSAPGVGGAFGAGGSASGGAATASSGGSSSSSGGEDGAGGLPSAGGSSPGDGGDSGSGGLFGIGGDSGDGGDSGSGGNSDGGTTGGDGGGSGGGDTSSGGANGGGATSSGGAPSSGGASPSGGAGSGGDAGAASCTGEASVVSTDGFIDTGDWSGLAGTWVGDQGEVGDSIEPDVFVGDDLCVCGTVGASDTSVIALSMPVAGDSSGALIGDGSWSIAGTGLDYSIDNVAGTPLRLVITVDDSRYCYEISGGVELVTGTIAWGDFSSTCWNSDPPDFPGSGSLTSIDFTAPGSASGEREPSFCLVSIGAAE